MRWPATARWTAWLCDWMPRTFVLIPFGRTSTSCSVLMAPESRVPVMTVPKPFMVNTRSMGRRRMPFDDLGETSFASLSSSRTRAGRFSAVLDETGTIGDFSRNVPLTNSRTSSWTRASQSFSTMSILVRTMSPFFTCRRSQMARCSRVWGMMPSSAAMTSITMSMPPTPASMFLIRPSWPGTSTMPRRLPPGVSREAKPRSRVMPRSFSSLRRSGSVPVRALTRLDFPWSICPAVPRMMYFIKTVE